MLQYTLQMSSEDCGGLTEYVEFFSNLRDVFSIADQRKELSSELRYPFPERHVHEAYFNP